MPITRPLTRSLTSPLTRAITDASAGGFNPATQADYFVSTTGSDANDGLTPATPKLTIVAVKPLFNAASGDQTVYVAPGTYKGGPRHQSDSFVSRRKITYYMAGVTIDNALDADAAFSVGVDNYSENLTVEVVGPCSIINVLNNSVGGGGIFTAGKEAITITRDVSVSGIGTNGDGISMHDTSIGYFYGGTVSSNPVAKSAVAHVGAGKGYHYGSIINCGNVGSNIKSSGTAAGASQAYFEDCVINATEPNTVMVSVNESGTNYGFARFTRCTFPVVGAGVWSNAGANGTNSTIELIDCYGGGVSVELNGQSIVRGCYGDWRLLTGRGNGTGNVLVENNVFSRTASEIFYWTAYNGTSYDGGAGGTIRNNIFIGATVAAIRSVTTAGAIDRINPLWSFQNNLFFNNTANYTAGLLIDGVDVTGQNPLLVTGSGDVQANWKVQAGSPAIGAGTAGSTIGIGAA